MTKRPYAERREVLGGLGLDGRSVKVPPRFVAVEGAVILSTAQQHGLEGCGREARRLALRAGPAVARLDPEVTVDRWWQALTSDMTDTRTRGRHQNSDEPPGSSGTLRHVAAQRRR
jgi:hypothetical protein